MASQLGGGDSTDSIGSQSSITRRKYRLYRRYNSNTSVSSELGGMDTSLPMASDEFPVRVPLETVQIGPWKYTSRDLEETDGEVYVSRDVELLYEHQSSDLIIKTSITGTKKALPGSYRIRSVSAADLSLFTVVPNSLESMVAKLVLETDQKIAYTSLDVDAGGKGSKDGCKSEARSEDDSAKSEIRSEGQTEIEGDEASIPSKDSDRSVTKDSDRSLAKNSDRSLAKKTDSEDDISQASRELDIHIVRLTASVHETGHLRDILHFQNCPCDLNLDSTASLKDQDTQDEKNTKPHLTLIEGLPYWVYYVPWMIYSKRTRLFFQRLLFLYTLLSVLWALWQLYRHVNIIRVVIQPIIVTLRYYLSSVVELFDWAFAVFTVWWHTLLSPLNVLGGLLLAPMLKLVTDLKWMVYPLYISVSHLFRSTGLLTFFTSISSVLYFMLRHMGTVLWMLFQVLLKPLNYFWTTLLNARVAVASMDFQRMRFSWVFSLVLGSIRSIIRGLATFVGYTRREKIIKKAMESSTSSPLVSPVSTPSSTARRRNESMPIIYSSPLTKQH